MRSAGIARQLGVHAADAKMNLDGEDSREDLRSLRDTARRAAILLMVAAWYADRRVPRAKPPEGSGAAEQPDLFGGAQ